MNYPVWDVPVIGSGWTIGIIAIIHILISHFAVGGGIFLPMAEAKAIREGRKDWFPALEKFSKFFLILTGVFGAMTGVGIWFSIGLANPEGTSALIHNFVFGWAIEWVFFLVELTLAAAYYYTWGKVSERDHLRLGWAYAIASIGTLVIITGILTFKLTPGGWLAFAGSGEEPHHFFEAFFNAGYLPSLGLRILVCVSLAGIWALVYFGGMDGETEGPTKEKLVRWAAKWILPAYSLMPVFALWYYTTIPADHRELFQLGVSTIGQGAFTHVTRMALMAVLSSATIALVIFLFAWLFPRELTRGQGLAILFLALLATASGESVREFLRKPFVVNGYLYSNGVRVLNIDKVNRVGYLANSPWAKPVTDTTLPSPEIGLRMFQGQCMACHTVDGYRSMKRLAGGRDGKAIGSILKILKDHKPESPYYKYMPPLVGNAAEIESLRQYLDIMANGKLTSGVVDTRPKPAKAGADTTVVRTDSAKVAPVADSLKVAKDSLKVAPKDTAKAPASKASADTAKAVKPKADTAKRP